MNPACPNCQISAELTDGREVYPHRPDLHDKNIYVCRGCGARVGCHPGTIKPLGIPADPKLRRARMLLHNERLDPLWQTPKGKPKEKGARKKVYRFLAHHMGIEARDCHTAHFDIEQCRQAWTALAGVTFEDVKRWYEQTSAARAEKKSALSGAVSPQHESKE